MAAPACRRGGDDSDATRFHLQVGRVVTPETESFDVASAVQRAQAGTKHFGADHPTALEVVVSYALLSDADGYGVLRVEIEAPTPDAFEADLGPTLSATVELTRADGTLAPDRDLPDAVERAVAVLDARITLARGSDAQRRALLAAEDAEIVLLALEWITRQQARRFADDVVVALESDSDRVRLAAVESLGRVGGPEHVAALIRRPRLRDQAHARRLYEALGQLGGDAAAGFLSFAVRNEEDQALADVAEAALRRASMSAGRPTVSVAEPTPEAGRGHRGAQPIDPPAEDT